MKCIGKTERQAAGVYPRGWSSVLKCISQPKWESRAGRASLDQVQQQGKTGKAAQRFHASRLSPAEAAANVKPTHKLKKKDKNNDGKEENGGLSAACLELAGLFYGPSSR